MALLRYENLDVRRPDILLKSAFHGLGTFFRFLDQTKKHMESEAAVQRLAVKPGVAPEEDQARPNMLTLQRQIKALQFLQNEPSPAHLPLYLARRSDAPRQGEELFVHERDVEGADGVCEFDRVAGVDGFDIVVDEALDERADHPEQKVRV